MAFRLLTEAFRLVRWVGMVGMAYRGRALALKFKSKQDHDIEL